VGATDCDTKAGRKSIVARSNLVVVPKVVVGSS